MSDELIYQRLISLKRDGGEAVLVTVIEKLSEGPARVGAKMLVLPDGSHIGTVGGGSLELSAVKKALEFMRAKSSGIVRYNLNASADEPDEVHVPMVCGGKVTLFFEYVTSGPSVYIFGAGNVGREIAALASKSGFLVTVFDPSEKALDLLDPSVKKVRTDYHKLFNDFSPRPESFFIVCTLSHRSDFMVLRRLLRGDYRPAYIGMLASEHKLLEVMKLLKEELGADVPEIDKLYSPIGLDIGGETPSEIAVSVVAEMQGLRYGRKNLPHKSAVHRVVEMLSPLPDASE